MRRFLLGFVFAYRGLLHLIASQRNFRFHLLIAAPLVVLAAAWLKLAAWEWIALLIAIALVLSLEAMNTALEILADRVNREHDPLIALAKDAAAAAVLLAAVGAAVVGLIVFLPHL
ncbi:MAG: diacylglycerol kinase family protein [Hydrogenophilaceae bacterium]|nr:diacylglycerol kinase family protein [Hydrogenophilaceae bacterium]